MSMSTSAGSAPPRDKSIRKDAQEDDSGLATRPKNFSCTRCGKSFGRRENLTRHQATHLTTGKFRCSICPKHFSRSDILNKHRKLHNAPAFTPSEDEPAISNVTTTPPALSSAAGRSNDKLWRAESQPYLQSSDVSGFAPSMSYPHIGSVPTSVEPLRFHSSQAQNQDMPVIPTSGDPFHRAKMNANYGAQNNFNSMTDKRSGLSNSIWDGFMMYGDTPSFSIGSYDADMAWTLDFAQSQPSVDFLFNQLAPSVDGLSEIAIHSEAQQLPDGNQLVVDHPLPEKGNLEDTLEIEDEDATEWPDRASRAVSPVSQYRGKVRMSGAFWNSVIGEVEQMKTQLEPERQTFSFRGIDQAIRQSQVEDLGLKIAPKTKGIEVDESIFPPLEILDYFLLLYFRYIHTRFPVLHPPTFNLSKTPPLLLTAMMLLGSSHSKSNRGRFSTLFFYKARMALLRNQETDVKFMRSVDNILTFFLICLGGTWSGDKQSYEFAEGARGVLVTACRRCRLLDCRRNTREEDSNQRPTKRSLDSTWLAWIDIEKRKRLGLSIYIFDCQYPTFFNSQPYVSKAETTNCAFPCLPEYWDAQTADMWKMLIGPADMPPSTYFIYALNCCLLRKRIVPAPPVAKADNFGQTFLIYALHTHIFEWRQKASMLNPEAMMDAGNSAHKMGDSLRITRTWLLGSLDSWYECYWTPSSDVAASLLHQLGYVSLHVSLSDLHLAAGRSESTEDGELAEQTLRCWANSESADITMTHVKKMLEIAHDALNQGLAASSSYEMALSFFTGGILSWAYSKLHERGPYPEHTEEVRKASQALREMGCWRMCSMFGVILKGFE